MGRLQALLFDCDGVLVDTERDGHRVAFNEAFAKKDLKVSWSPERYGELLHTAGGKERMRRHFDETGWPVAERDRDGFIKDLHKLKTDLFMALIADGKLPLRPGIARIMREAIDAGVTIAVCSTSNERAVQSIVDVLLGADVAPHVTVFAGDMVKAKKPDPEIYLMAVNRLQLDPAKCLVVEDSHIGLTAADAAGIRCLVTKSSYTEQEDFRAATKVVSELGEGASALELPDLESLLI
ncbi:HAD-IA family hydrolase [Pelagibius sp. Alg239-R121]|uniref:HAD-IA family hydrolase n=1 Tax=Pelagibius sp. Alg239-R121 TaxID=2993448 RepID=UPI0024A75C0B|nr:HAD-IA family hydrolase [Pelagibius sp. Alg239-R121]